MIQECLKNDNQQINKDHQANLRKECVPEKQTFIFTHLGPIHKKTMVLVVGSDQGRNKVNPLKH